MKIGEMASNMMALQKNQNSFINKQMDAQKQISTGKRVNEAADDPGAIARIQKTKALLSETAITKTALEDASNRNELMETTLNEMGNMASELGTLAIEKGGVAADTELIEKQAAAVLDAMVDMQANTTYKGSNPFTDGKNSVRLTGGNQLEMGSSSFQITKSETDPALYNITLNDGTTLEDQSVAAILDSSFVQDNLASQITESKVSIGINDRILKSRQNIEAKQEEVLTKSLSQMEDADLAKAAIESNIASTMANLNQELLGSSSRQMQSQVGAIFNMLA